MGDIGYKELSQPLSFEAAVNQYIEGMRDPRYKDTIEIVETDPEKWYFKMRQTIDPQRRVDRPIVNYASPIVSDIFLNHLGEAVLRRRMMTPIQSLSAEKRAKIPFLPEVFKERTLPETTFIDIWGDLNCSIESTRGSLDVRWYSSTPDKKKTEQIAFVNYYHPGFLGIVVLGSDLRKSSTSGIHPLLTQESRDDIRFDRDKQNQDFKLIQNNNERRVKLGQVFDDTHKTFTYCFDWEEQEEKYRLTATHIASDAKIIIVAAPLINLRKLNQELSSEGDLWTKRARELPVSLGTVLPPKQERAGGKAL